MDSVDRLDHLVLTVRDVARTCAFYSEVLGMQIVSFDGDRRALAFGNQKINLHEHGHELEPGAAHPVPGSADLCFTTSVPLAILTAHLASCEVEMIAGPVRRVGATGLIDSIYIRDPDGNLLEVANPVPDA